ncbi:MAG: glycoside hydrolase family 127 protein [Bacteroidales bacterium]|nr:glycoside hydrolase family 127 protein [Bacteroidales bacterium]
MKRKRKHPGKVLTITGLFLSVLLLAGCSDKQDAKTSTVESVPFTSVTVTDNFWAPRLESNRRATIPIAIEQSEITGRIKNFEVAAGMVQGEFCSEYPFDDSDVFKIIEGASYSLQTYPDPELEALLDTLL